MAIQLSTAIRNGELDQIQSVPGTSAVLVIWTGSVPANCAAADTGTELVEMNLPSSWMNAASGGQKTLSGSWTGAATAAGTAGYFRIYDTTEGTCHIQGTCGIGTGDLQLDNTNIAIGQVVTVTSFTLTAANS